jgi:hypothetical protein
MVVAACPNVPKVVTSQPIRRREADDKTRLALKQNPAPVARNYVGYSRDPGEGL